jgi:uncharacterized protein (DUF1684 family)
MNPATIISLLEWKRQVVDLYREVRATSDPRDAWSVWRAGRDRLFADHDQSPLPPNEREEFQGLDYFDYDPDARVLGELAPTEPKDYDIATSGEVPYRFTRFSVAAFELHGRGLELELFWLDAYGGGLFLSFADATSGHTTYGAGRYLLDTVKGADLGTIDGRLVLDFNFAYNPSCAYDPRWVCPLAPAANRLPVAIEAGERFG